MSEATELVEKYADKLVKGMGDIAPEAWEIMVRGQVVSGIHDAVFSVLWAAVFAGAIFTMRALWRNDDASSEDCSEWVFALIIVAAVFALLAFFLTLTFLSGATMSLLSPEYMALKELMK